MTRAHPSAGPRLVFGSVGVRVPSACGEGGVLGGGPPRKSGRRDSAAGCLAGAGGEHEHVS